MYKPGLICLLALYFALVVACSQTDIAESSTSNEKVGVNSGDSSNSGTSSNTFSDETDAANWVQVTPEIAVMGRVMKEPDASNYSPENPRFEYEIYVKLRNTGNAPVEYDSTMLSFVPESKKPFEIEQTSRDLKDQRKVKVELLETGEEEDWQFGTDGWTDAILEKADGKPVVYEMTVRKKGKPVIGPIRAELPPLDSLPLAKAGEKDQPASYLKFSTRP